MSAPAVLTHLAAAALTKSEGMLFAAAALASLLAVTGVRRRQLLVPAALATVTVLVALLPWRLFVRNYDLTHPDYELSNLVDRSFLADTWYRVEPVTTELLRQLLNTGSWGLLLPLFAVGVVVAGCRRDVVPTAFVLGWIALSFVGLVLIYWITVRPLSHNLFNTSNRTVAALLVGMALVAPVLVGRSSRRETGAT
jgi:hypothetical protein